MTAHHPSTPSSADEREERRRPTEPPAADTSERHGARTSERRATETTAGHAASTTDHYTVRPFRPEDEEAIRHIGGGNLAPMERGEWFEWVARENPYVEDVPMAIVEQADEVVAALPLLAVRIRAGDREALAFGCGEPVVALGHDEEELATRAITGAIDYYVAAALSERPPMDVDVVTSPDVDERAAAADVDEFPAMFFGVGTGESGVVAERVPWSKRAERAADYRVQRHGAFVANRIPGPPGRMIGAGISAITTRVRRWRDGRASASFDTGPYTVMRHRGVPDATLEACFERSTPPDAHVVYDQAFYDWWYSRPDVERVTSYVVYRGSEVAAGLVTHHERDAENGIETLHVDNVVPVTGDPERPTAIAAGMERLLAEQAGADVIRIGTPLVPNSVLSAYGFRSGDKFPTSMATGEPSVLGLRPLIDGQRTLGTRPVGETGPFLWPLA